MPAFKNYTANIQGAPISGGRRATPEDMGAVDLSGIAHTVSKAAEGYLEEKERDEQRTMLVENQKLRAKAVEDLRKAELNGDPIEPIQQQLDESLAKLGEGAMTKRGIEALEYYSTSTKEAVTAASMALDARRTGRKLANQGKEFDAAAAAQLQADPTALDRLLAERKDLIETYAGRVPPELLDAARREGQESLTAASVHSVIEADPALAEKLLRDPKHEPWGALRPEQRAALINTAQTAVRNQDAERRIKDAEKRKAMAEAGDAALNDILVAQADGKLGQYNIKELLRRPDIDPDRRLQISQIYQALARPPKLEAEAANSAYADIFRPEGDPRRMQSPQAIDDLLVAGRIDPARHRELRQAFANRERPETQLEGYFFSRVESLINPKDMLGRILSPDGPVNAVKFRRDITALRQEWAKDPKKDASLLLDPRTPEYQRYVEPLLNQYRPSTIFVPDEKGNVQPQAVPGPVTTVRSAQDLAALSPGAKFREPSDPPGKFRVKPAQQPGINEVRGKIRGAEPVDVDAMMRGNQ